MYFVKKSIDVASAHKLNLSYESPCNNLHGHTYHIEVCACSERLNNDGMVIDFKWIKSTIDKKFDHKYINDEFNFNTTSENLASWISDYFTGEGIYCYKVTVCESGNNTAVYVRPGFEKEAAIL